MKEYEAINYLENLREGRFLTVNIPIFRDEVKPITVMYLGKDKIGRYKFVNKESIIFSTFVLSKEIIERGEISIDKSFDKDKAYEIYSRGHILQNKIQHKKNREMSR